MLHHWAKQEPPQRISTATLAGQAGMSKITQQRVLRVEVSAGGEHGGVDGMFSFLVKAVHCTGTTERDGKSSHVHREQALARTMPAWNTALYGT